MTTRKTAHTRAGGCVSSVRPIGCWPRAKTSPTSPGAECSGADLLPVAESVRRVESRRRQEIYHDARGEGWTVNGSRRSNGCGATRGCGCRNTAGANGWAPRPRPTPAIADAPNRVWAVDFQFDVHDRRPAGQDGVHGRRAHPRMPRRPRRTLHHRRPAHRRTRPARRPPGYPAVLRCDNGPELACAAMAEWAGERVGLALHPARPTVAERLHRILQRPGPRRMPQPPPVLVTRPQPGS